MTALGELKVDEEAYAEAGSPIHARVVQAVVSPGQYVRRGQPLATIYSPDVLQAQQELLTARTRAAAG